jgi:ketosteroid isomerase-like protein
VSIDHRALIERFADIMSRNEWDALSGVFTSDAVLEFPQSGEVFRGIRNIRGQYENYPGGLEEGRIAAASVFAEEPAYALTPTYTLIAVDGTGKRGTATFRTQYPDGSKWWAVTHFETDGDRISHSRVFFAPEFEGPEWRAPFREPPHRN